MRIVAKSFRAKITLLLLGVVTCSALVFGVLAATVLKGQIEADLRLHAGQAVSALARSAGDGAMWEDRETLEEICAEVLASPMVAGAGIFTTSGESLAILGEGLDPALIREAGEARRDLHTTGSSADPYVLAIFPVLERDAGEKGDQATPGEGSRAPAYAIVGRTVIRSRGVLRFAQVAIDTTPRRALLSRWILNTIILTALLLGLGALGSVYLAGLILRPLGRLYQGTQKVAQGDLDICVPCTSGDEVGVLTSSFNQMVRDLRSVRGTLVDYSQSLEHTVDQRTQELLQTQDRLARSEKLGALGQLVAGVAHDLNNPLTAIHGYVQLLQGRKGRAHRKRWLEAILTEVQRSKKIVHNLLLFAQQRVPERGPVDVNELLRQTIRILSPQIPGDVTLTCNLEKDRLMALGDRDQLQEVFVNLMANAIQAVRDHKGTGRVQVSALASEDSVQIHVDDDGPGIPPEKRAKVLEPFFTTKPLGQGTGLGLSICAGILQQHQGGLEISTSPLGGARFTVNLEAVTAAEDAADPVVETARSRPAPREGHGESILVVEDEESICEILQTALQSHNYRVDTADSLREARDKLAAKPYELILSDFRLVDGDARTLRDHVQETHPALLKRFLIMTGDTVSPGTREFLEETGCPYLPKPFEIDEVLAFVSASMASRN